MPASPAPTYRRGDIFWIDFPNATGSEQGGARPVVIVSNNYGNESSPTVIVAILSTKIRKKNYPMHVQLPKGAPLGRAGVVKCEHLYTVDKTRLRDPSGRLPPLLMVELDEALHHSLALP